MPPRPISWSSPVVPVIMLPFTSNIVDTRLSPTCSRLESANVMFDVVTCSIVAPESVIVLPLAVSVMLEPFHDRLTSAAEMSALSKNRTSLPGANAQISLLTKVLKDLVAIWVLIYKEASFFWISWSAASGQPPIVLPMVRQLGRECAVRAGRPYSHCILMYK